MPFAMTHLHIAYNILNSTTQIKNPCDFMLGAIAPDSVHFRDEYDSDMKKKSHLCVGEEKWGRTTNNQEWLKSVLDFLHKNRTVENTDFIYGYCSHILADIQNNIKIWTPFLLENKEDLENGLGSIYHKESSDMDYELYLRSPHQKIIFEMIEDATGYDIPDVVRKDEINKMKDTILNSQYLSKKSVDVSCNKYVTLPCMEEFISVESQYIRNLLYNND